MAYLIFASIDDRMLERFHKFAQFFEQQQHRVEVVTDGRVVLEKAQIEMPDVLVADVMLPGRDGFDLLKILRQGPDRARQPAIILVTVLSADMGTILEGDNTVLAPLNGFLVRPYPDESDDRVFREQFLLSVGLTLAKRAAAATTPDTPRP